MAGNGARLERAIEIGTAGLFACACAVPPTLMLPTLGATAYAVAGLSAIGGYALVRHSLSALDRSTTARPIAFDIAALPALPPVEPLHLRPEDEVRRASHSVEVADTLILDDVLEALDPQARVVQIFGRQDRSTAGEMAARIERHLDRRSLMEVPDASDELFDALNQLRRSLQ